MLKHPLSGASNVWMAVLAIAVSSLSTFCFSQDRNQVLIDASAPYTVPSASSFQTGTATSPSGKVLGLNERYLTLNGKPWLPVMGEFHYTRVPEAEWEEEILKMKAAGVQIIATYVIWLHHEEIEGQFDWSGDRDLRRFVDLCGKHGMYVYARIGPWAHGEVRHGGFPDWLLTKGPTRTDAPVYMSYVGKYYAAIGNQLHGLLWKDGGPVIGIQLENEYSDRTKGGGEEYILALKKLAIGSGLDVPFYSVTGWDNAVVPNGAVLPVFGGYPDAPWISSLQKMPAGEVYNFRFGSRVTGNMGMLGGKAATGGSVDKLPTTPFITAEMGGGIQDTYHRRPVLTPDDVVAMFPVMLGSGVNLYGTYMFQGGENPDGKLTTLQESQATGYPTDVPVKSYDFQAPLGEFGEERESFRKLKVFDYFLNDFGGDLAPMLPHAPTVVPESPRDLSVPRLSVRTRGDSGFLFENNYVRGVSMPARQGFQVSVKLPHSTLRIPEHPVTIPSDSYFIWPFNMDLSGATLRYSTAQLFTKLTSGDRITYFFLCIPDLPCEFAFVDKAGVTVRAASATVSHERGVTYVRGIQPGLTASISVNSPAGAHIRIVVLSQEQAENAWKVHLDGEGRLMLTKQQFFASRDQITLRSDEEPAFKFTLIPAMTGDPHASQTLRMDQRIGEVATYSASTTPVQVDLQQQQLQEAKDVPVVKVGPGVSWRPRGVAEAPEQSTFADAAKWRLELGKNPLQGLSNLFLRINYVGDVARLSDGSKLLDDNFFNGMPWLVGMKRYVRRGQTGDLQLSILPLRVDSPIFLEDWAKKSLPPAGQVEKLQSIKVIPQYQLTIQTAR